VVDEVAGLALDGLDDLRVAVAGGGDRDPGVEVEEAVAVDVLDGAAGAAGGHEVVDPGHRRAGDGGVAGDPLGGLRAGQLGRQVRDRGGGEVDGGRGVGEVVDRGGSGGVGHVGAPPGCP